MRLCLLFVGILLGNICYTFEDLFRMGVRQLGNQAQECNAPAHGHDAPARFLLDL